MDSTNTGNEEKISSNEINEKMRRTDSKNIVAGRKSSNGKNNIQNKNKNVKVPGILTYADVLKNKNYEKKIKSVSFDPS